MKKTIKYLMGASAILLFASCTNLDENIYSDVKKDDFFKSETQVALYAGRAYNTLQNWGTEQSWWTLDIQLGDECCVPKNSIGEWSQARYGELQTHAIPANNKLVMKGWDFCFDGITACNDVIYEIENSKSDFNGKEEILAEMKILRAFYYFLAADAFGNIPYSVDKKATEYPAQKDRKFFFTFIEKEIKDNIDVLSAENNAEHYGRVTQGMAYTLLTKLYLQAECWGLEEKWAEAADAAKTVITSGKYQLEEQYKANFKTNNETSKESIFAIPYSTIYTTSSDNTFCLFVLALNSTLAEYYNISNYWDGFIGQPDFFQTYEANDSRKSDTFIYGETPIEGYVIEPVFPESKYTSGRSESEGAYIQKWTYQTDGLLTGDDTSMDNDFILFRYADVILMYAEALLRDGKSLDSHALDGLNKIRERADLTKINDWNLEKLYSERSHEMALEGWRRMDMIRFGQYRKRWFAKPNETPETGLLLPIPAERKSANPNLKQNPGY